MPEDEEDEEDAALPEQKYPPGATQIINLKGTITTTIDINLVGDPFIVNKVAEMLAELKQIQIKKTEDQLRVPEEPQEDTPEETPEEP